MAFYIATFCITIVVFAMAVVTRWPKPNHRHGLADTSTELLAMADRIGVARRWLQKGGTVYEHFDICISKRRLAVAAGASEITLRESGWLIRAKREATL